MEITLVIPTYNEAGNIPILVEKVFKIFDDNELDGHIIIIDDDSPDQTWSVAENLISMKCTPQRLTRTTIIIRSL